MKRVLTFVAAIALATAPSAALANSTTVRLVLHVPVQCSIDMLGGTIENNRLTMQVHRSCNTGHDVVVSGQPDDSLGAVTVTYNGGSEMLSGNQIVLPQAERYYDQTDTVVIVVSDGDAQDLLRLASTLRLSVVVA